MLQKIENKRRIIGKGCVLCRWAITISVILFIAVYQLGMKSSSAEVSFSPVEKSVISTEAPIASTEVKEMTTSAPLAQAEVILPESIPTPVKSEEAQVVTEEITIEEPVKEVARGPYLDGEAEGEGEGYGGPVKIRLSIKNGWIEEIIVEEAYGEDKPYLRDAKKIIPKVIEKQSTDLDAISGATTTCWAILDAVDMALMEKSK
ncbi:MAG: FMN-binding protein [Sphaerochaetaceae bacterium]|nr:FMN-binding protein [Sphaerochaetaceae bacterium]